MTGSSYPRARAKPKPKQQSLEQRRRARELLEAARIYNEIPAVWKQPEDGEDWQYRRWRSTYWNSDEPRQGGQAFWNVPPEVQRWRRQTADILKNFLHHARGDPRLTAWEEMFLASMADLHRRTHGYVELSDKQARIILQIEDKLRGQPPTEGEDADQEAAD